MGSRIGLVVVVLAVAGVVALKAASPAPAPAAVADPVRPATAPAPGPSVVMVADPREADTQCPCGEIIRRVRAARASGVAVDEFGPDDAEAARRYGVTVVPTVVFLEGGKVVARHEGESSEILAAITAGLVRLEGARR